MKGGGTHFAIRVYDASTGTAATAYFSNCPNIDFDGTLRAPGLTPGEKRSTMAQWALGREVCSGVRGSGLSSELLAMILVPEDRSNSPLANSRKMLVSLELVP
jgi:hypothetical protein